MKMPPGPFGAKSVGEPTNELAAPAIVNAIYNATGKRIYEIPANLERVLLGHKLVRTGKRGSEQKEILDTDSCKDSGNGTMNSFEYFVPKDIKEVCKLLAEYSVDAKILAGGTDVLIELRKPTAKSPKVIIDISRIVELNGIEEN